MLNIKTSAVFKKHPTEEGVFLKHFFGKEDNDRLILVLRPDNQI